LVFFVFKILLKKIDALLSLLFSFGSQYDVRKVKGNRDGLNRIRHERYWSTLQVFIWWDKIYML